MKKILAFLAVFLLVGCATAPPTPDQISGSMQKFVGHTQQEVILAWGVDYTLASDGAV